MAEYNQYIVNNKTISEILEDSANRQSISPFTSFNIGERSSSGTMSFAKYVNTYHPFTIDTQINNYLANSISSQNKGCVPKGFAPLINNQIKFSGNTKIYVYVTGSGSALSNSRIRIIKSDNTEIQNFTSPNVIILGIQAAGGGGAGGTTGIAGGIGGKGGGNGGYIPLHVELPYLNTSETCFLTIELGGSGVNANGGNSVLKLGRDGETLITLVGGIKGSDCSFYNNYGNTINNNTLKNGGILGTQGSGRLKICSNYRYLSFWYSSYDMNNSISGYGVGGFSGGGEYVSGTILTMSLCSRLNYTITSGDSSSNSIKFGFYDGSYGGSGNAGPGAGSMMGTGGYSGGGGVFGGNNGGSGTNGSGGGGGARGGIFWSGAGSGGSGGNGAIEIYY